MYGGSAVSCSGSLDAIWRLLGSRYWLRQLNGGVRTVRVVFEGPIYRLTRPLSLKWGVGPTKDIRLELVGGDPSHKATLSGDKLGDPMEEGASGPNAKSDHRLEVFDLSGWPRFEAPPASGFEVPIRPVMAELFDGDNVLPIAAWPNRGYGRLDRPAGLESGDHRTFTVKGRNPSDWLSEPDLLAFAGYRVLRLDGGYISRRCNGQCHANDHW